MNPAIYSLVETNSLHIVFFECCIIMHRHNTFGSSGRQHIVDHWSSCCLVAFNFLQPWFVKEQPLVQLTWLGCHLFYLFFFSNYEEFYINDPGIHCNIMFLNCLIVLPCSYVVDAADHDNVSISRSEIHDLLSKPSLGGIPLLVLGNKIDKPGALSKQALTDQM